MKPDISVITPIYNAEKYLTDYFKCLNGQTFTNFEVLCVNDGSTDSTLELLKEQAMQDTRYRIIEQKNAGPGVARNNAIKQATGKYLAFLDVDDCYYPNGLECLYQQAEKTAADVVFARVDSKIINSIEPNKNLNRLTMEFYNQPTDLERTDFILWANMAPFGRFVLRDFWNNSGIHFSEHYRGEDQLVHWMTCLLGKTYTVSKESVYLYTYPVIAGDIHKYSRSVMNMFDVFDEIHSFLTKKELQEQFALLYKRWELMHYEANSPLVCPEDRNRYFSEILKRLKKEDYLDVRHAGFALSKTERNFYQLLFTRNCIMKLYYKFRLWYHKQRMAFKQRRREKGIS